MTKCGARVAALLGESSILSLADACDLVPLRLSVARRIAWMRARGIVRDFDGLEVVILGDILQALRGEHGAPAQLAEPKAPNPWDTLERAPVGRK